MAGADAQPRAAGSTTIRSAPSLFRALRIAATSLTARTSAGPALRGAAQGEPVHRRAPIRRSAVGLDRPEQLGIRPAARPGPRTRPAPPRPPSTRDQLDRRREARLRPLGQLAGGEAGRVHPDQGLQGPARALPHRDHRAAVGPAADQGDHVQPAPQRLLGGPQVGPQQQQRRCPAAPHRRTRPSAGGSAPGVATTMPGVSGHPVQHPPADRRSAPGSAGRPCPAPRPSARAPTIGARTRRRPADRALPVDLAAGRTRRTPAAGAARSCVRVGPEQYRQRTGSRQSWQTRASR